MNHHHPTPTLAAPVTATDHFRGDAKAPVVVIEYGDFECSICAAVAPAVKQLCALHPADMMFVFRHFPLEDAHPHALMAAEAAEAAAAQQKFWPMHDLLLTKTAHLDRHHLDTFAEVVGLDMVRFKAEMDDEIYRQRIREQQAGARSSHIRATPTFFVNGVVQDVSAGMEGLFELVAAEVKKLTAR